MQGVEVYIGVVLYWDGRVNNWVQHGQCKNRHLSDTYYSSTHISEHNYNMNRTQKVPDCNIHNIVYCVYITQYLCKYFTLLLCFHYSVNVSSNRAVLFSVWYLYSSAPQNV